MYEAANYERKKAENFCRELIEKLKTAKSLTHSEWVYLLKNYTKEDAEYASEMARNIAVEKFGRQIYFRGIIEFTNHCKCDCYYCGIRCSNKNVERYRLTKEEILECCQEGYENGFRTFVLQGGEDGFYTDEVLIDILRSIRESYSDCAITLSVGERSKDSYQKLFEAGADRYLLRHETSVQSLFEKIHPPRQKMENRLRCLKDLKGIGYQTGCGIMVGVPYQTLEDIASDMVMMGEFQPHMIGIGPFLPHSETPFKDQKAGDAELTLFLLSLCRIMLPDVMLPATTALGTLRDDGRKKGVLAGCNVVMPNLSPKSVREKYLLYNNKAGIHDSAKSGILKLSRQMDEIGYQVIVTRGDYAVKR